MVRSIGLEPTTPTMSRWCSNQLSYERNVVVTTGTHINGRGGRVARGKRHFSCRIDAFAELFIHIAHIFTDDKGYFFNNVLLRCVFFCPDWQGRRSPTLC